MGCKKEKVDPFEKDLNLEKILNSPYSKLTPEEQKVKLEHECIDLLNELNAATSLQAIDVLKNFIDLLDINSPDVYLETEGQTSTQTIFQVTNTYGVYAWSASKRAWTKTASDSELKFEFPSKGKSGSNNATLSMVAGKTGITVTNVGYDEYWDYDCWCWIDESYEEIVQIPTSVTSKLSVDNKEIAKIETSAQYKKNTYEYEDFKIDGYPEKSSFKITTAEKYSYEYQFDGNGKETKLKMLLTHDKKTLIEGVFKTDIQIKDVLDNLEDIEDFEDTDFYDIFGKVSTTAYIKMMDNLVLAYQIDDMSRYLDEIIRIESEWYDNEPDWRSADYYKNYEKGQKKYSDDFAAVMNKYLKISLVSLKDGTKIAEFTYKSQKTDEYYDQIKFLSWDDYLLKEWNDYYSQYGWWDSYQDFYNERRPQYSGEGRWDWDWNYPYVKLYDEYSPVAYLRFNDNTLVETEAYFSTGFSELESKWEDFVNAFNR